MSKGDIENNIEIIELKKMADMLSEAFYVVDKNGRFIIWNEAFRVMFGYSNRQIEKMTVENLCYGNSSMMLKKKMRMVFSTGKKNVAECQMKSKKGKSIAVKITGQRMFAAGKAYIVGLVIDASVQEKLSEDKEESYKLMELVFNNIGDSMVYLDFKGNILKINEAFIQQSGYKRQEIEGKKFFIFRKHFSRASFMKMVKSFRHLLKGDLPDPYVVDAINKKNGKLKLEVRNFFIEEKEKRVGFAVAMRDVTKQYSLRSLLSEQELQFRTLIKYSQAIIFIIGIDGKFILSEGKALKALGLKADEVVGVSALRMYKDYPTIINGIKDAWRGKVTETDVMAHNKKGEERYFNIFFAPHKNADGDIIGCLGTAVDITDTKNAIKELELSTRKYRTLVDTSPDCVKLFDVNGNLLYINNGGKKEHRLTNAKDVKMFDPFDSVVAQDKSLMKEAFNEALRGTRSSVEVRHKKSKSTREVCRETFVPVKNSEGEIESVYGVSVDLSDIKRNEKELQDAKNEYQRLLDSSPFPVVIVRDYKIVYVNMEASRLVGVKKNNTIIGTSIEKLIYTDKPPKVNAVVQKIIGGKNIDTELEATIIRLDGGKREISFKARRTQFEDKSAVQIVFQDITSQKKYEKTILQYKNIVESSTDMLALIDKNYVCITANERYAEAFKMDINDLIGKKIVDIYGKDVFNQVIKSHMDDCLKGEFVNYWSWFDFPVYGRQFMDVSYSPYYENNVVIGLVVSSRDISDRKAIEETLNDKIQQLNDINNFMVDRELKMIELKKTISKLTNGKNTNKK